MERKRKHSAAAQPPKLKSPPPPPKSAPVLEVEDSDEEYVEEIEEEEEESESDDEGSDSDEVEEGPESESDDEEESESEEEEEEEEEDDEIRDDDEESVKKEKIRKLLTPFSKDELIAILNEAAKSDTWLIPSLIKTIESNPVHKKLFVYGLAFHVDDAMLASAFSKFGAVESAAVVGETSTGKSKGYGFVVFEDRVAARKAIKEGSLNVGGKVCSFQLSVHGSRAAVGGAAGGDVKTVTKGDEGERKLYVANVRENVDKERLKVFFEQFGEIETGPIGWDRFTGKFKGYALIVYKTVKGLRKALEQPIKVFEGNVFRCSKATDKSRQGVAGQGGVVAGQNATQGGVPGQNQNPGQEMVAQNVNLGWMGQNPNPSTGVPPQNPAAGTYNPYLGGNEAAVGAAAVSGGMVVSGAGAAGAAVAAGVGAGAGVGMGVTPSFPGAPSAGYFPGANTGSAGFFPGAISAGAIPGAVPAGSFPGAVPAGSYSGVASAGSFLGAAPAGSLPGVTAAGWFPGATSTGSFPGASYPGAASVGSFPGAAFPGAASAGSFPGSVAAGSFPGAVSTGPLTGAKSAGLHPSAVSTGTTTPVSTSQGATRAYGGTGGINTISPSVIGSYAARVGLQGLGSSAASSGFAGRGQNNAGSSFHPQFNR